MLIICDVIGLVQLMMLVWATYLQGHIWRVGYENGELKGVVFDDVPEALVEWHIPGHKNTHLFQWEPRSPKAHLWEHKLW